jgi:DNA primase
MQVEGRLKADIRVTTLPDGLDPDEIALDDPERWSKLVADAKPVVIHVMETLAARSDVDDPKVKEEIAGQVLPLIEDVKGSVEREAYRQRLARLLQVDERALVGQSSGGVQRRGRSWRPMTRVIAPTVASTDTTHRLLEGACIKALLTDPTLVHFINRPFRAFELACLHSDDFSHTDYKEAFKLIKESLDQDFENPLDYVRGRLPEPLKDALLDADDKVTYPNWRFQPNAPIFESLLIMFIRLRRVRIDEGLDQLVFLQMQERDEEDEPLDINKIAMDYVRARAKLDQALQKGKNNPKDAR